ncbi:MAG: DNA polymerase III subunit gamma/tau [Endomicrobium sp.]|jgi:DNA polymerase-3 subunit gamma/tau|nr:DNA polymerase III subunit gamma/tau [Endomicrobium sp.]
MSYIVLARKYRPKNFDEIVGQDHISRTLKNAISENRIAHAYLFSGPRGCGKTTMARIFAKSLNCKKGTTINPCEKCKNCFSISNGSDIDVLEIDGASNNGIDEIRALRENVKFSSVNSKYKIYIMDEAHQITTQAFNALLKTLEEPPVYVVFIMVTTEQHKIPITILSRCQRYRFKLISNVKISSVIMEICRKEGFKIDIDTVNIIASMACGSMRDALSLLEQVISSSNCNIITLNHVRELFGLIPKNILISVVENIVNRNTNNILKIVEEIFREGYNILQFIRDLRDYLRRIMIYSINPLAIDIPLDEKSIFDNQKTLFSLSCYIRMSNLLSKAIEEIRWHDQPKILLEIYLLKMSEPYNNVNELINKVVNLEKKIITEYNFENDDKEKDNELCINRNILTTENLLNTWNEIVSEIIKKHSLTGQSLKNVLIEKIDFSCIELSVLKQFDYDLIIGFKDLISDFFRKKMNLNIEVKIFMKKTDKNEKKLIPEHIKIIAKNFNAIVKKK